jgi:hypothetical protein
MSKSLFLRSIPILCFPIVTACVAETDDAVDVTAEEIHGSSFAVATQFQRDRALALEKGCTATRISATWALTAAHCMSEEEDDVYFYGAAAGVDANKVGEIEEVVLRPGVDAEDCYFDPAACYDTAGLFADIALIRLKSHNIGLEENDLDGPQANLAYEYPGDGAAGVKVGSGEHGGGENSTFVLLQTPDTTFRIDNGLFLTSQHQVDQGDSGGPFYYGHRIVGVLRGKYVGEQDYYTSVADHLPWILETIGYGWRGQPVQNGTKYTGTLLESFAGTVTECKYVCERRTSCEAYAVDATPAPNGHNCFLYDAVTSVTTDSDWKGALKHGTRTGQANNVVGYVRSSGIDAVVHVTNANRIHELVRQGGVWSWGDLQAQDFAPAVGSGGKVAAYRRGDGVNVAVYRSSANHIIELALVDGTWEHNDLTAITGAENAVGQPAAIVKADGVSAIYYRGATTNHIIELRLGSRGWVKRDLGSTSADTDPMAFVRSDGYTSVVFRAGTVVKELYQSPGSAWTVGAPSSLAGAAPATGRPFGFTHSDGTNAIVYRSTGGAIVQLTLAAGQWSAAQLATGATSDPVAYARNDMVESVVFRNAAGHVIEAANGTTFDLTDQTGAPAAAAGASPSIYHRVDGRSSVVFETSTGRVRELTLELGGSWDTADLTSAAGETP